jgi:AraC family transcriptional regulator
MQDENNIKIDYIDRVNNVLKYIDENLNSSLSLKALASKANFSIYHFHRIFYSIMNETPTQYQRRKRMENSATELYKEYTQVKEISSKMGFSSPSGYSRDFKKHFGKTPKDFRKELISRISIDNNININVVYKPCYTLAVSKITGFKNIIPSFIKLSIDLKRNFIRTGAMFEYVYDNQYITPLDKCRYDICRVVPENTTNSNSYNIVKTDKKLYAVYNLRGNTDTIDKYFNSIFSWIIRSEYIPDEAPLLIIFKRIFSLRPLLPIDYAVGELAVPIKSKI